MKETLINSGGNNMNMAVLDLFSGCGGLSQGFKEAGFNVMVANEIWEPAADTYEKNHPETAMVRGDITSQRIKQKILDHFKEEECDVIIGGPPCQAYSVAGLRKPDDPRGKLFRDYMQMVRKLQPKVFVMENVKGLLSIMIDRKRLKPSAKAEIKKLNAIKEEKISLLLKRRTSKTRRDVKFTEDDEKTLKSLLKDLEKKQKEIRSFQERLVDRILRDFRRMNYTVDFKVLNSAQYGVPQIRERVILIGTRNGIPIEFPEPTHAMNTEASTTLKPFMTVRDAIDDLKELKVHPEMNHVFSVHTEAFLKKIKKTKVGENISEAANAFHRASPDKPSWTVKDNHGSVFIHYEKDRVMTPRELARLQSFDDSYFFCSSKKNIYTQIGNAVPPRLAYAIAYRVKKMLKERGIEKVRVMLPEAC